MTTSIETETAPHNKAMRTTIIGGVVGALAGVVAALFFIRAMESPSPEDGIDSSFGGKASSGVAQPQRIHPAALIGVGITALNLLRQIANIGEK